MIAVMGPTGSGKTEVAEQLADALSARLLNADAFQIYRGLDIGTAKPVRRERYALLDIRDPRQTFGVGEFVELASAELKRAFDRAESVVVVGGTGLYIRALFEQYAKMNPLPDPDLRNRLMGEEKALGLEALAVRLKEIDPERAARTDLLNPARVRRALEIALDPRPPLQVSLPNFRRLKLALDPIRETLSARIDSRLRFMVQNGWVDEVRRLVGEGLPREAPGLRAIGYRALYDHVSGAVSLEEAVETIRIETRRYAKRQRTWLRSEPNLNWIHEPPTAEHATREITNRFFSQ